MSYKKINLSEPSKIKIFGHAKSMISLLRKLKISFNAQNQRFLSMKNEILKHCQNHRLDFEFLRDFQT